MTILTAAQCTSVKAATVAYNIEGFSVIPLWGKKPANGVRWQPFQWRRATLPEIHRWDKLRSLQNVGIVCGEISGNLVVMDCDSLEASALFETVFPMLVNTFTVATGSGRGYHYYFYADTLPPTTRAMNINGGNLELRANGCYVVATPSIHPETRKHYRVASPAPILRVKDLEAVRVWLQCLIKAKHDNLPPQTQRPPERKAERTMLGKGHIRNPAAYGRAALEKELQALCSTAQGNRNNQLNTAAYNLGQLVGDNILPRGPVEDALVAAAVSIGQDEWEAQRTVKSGIERGITATRSAQWYKRW